VILPSASKRHFMMHTQTWITRIELDSSMMERTKMESCTCTWSLILLNYFHFCSRHHYSTCPYLVNWKSYSVWKIFCLLFRGTHNCVRSFCVRVQPLICQLVCLGLSHNFFH
jgi:hypothetical protein